VNKATIGAIALALVTVSTLPAAAQPDERWQGGPDNRHWDASEHYRDRDNADRDERRLSRDDDIYRGHDGRYYCRRGDGTTGLVVGAIGGGILGGAIGGDALGALLGAAGGGAIGNAVDRGEVHCR
jgi:hypothetical protein